MRISKRDKRFLQLGLLAVLLFIFSRYLLIPFYQQEMALREKIERMELTYEQYNKILLKKMVFHEHIGLMLYGLACGIIAALIAVSPALKSPGAQVPYLSLTLTTLAIVFSGVVWIWISTSLALSGEMIDALRNE